MPGLAFGTVNGVGVVAEVAPEEEEEGYVSTVEGGGKGGGGADAAHAPDDAAPEMCAERTLGCVIDAEGTVEDALVGESLGAGAGAMCSSADDEVMIGWRAERCDDTDTAGDTSGKMKITASCCHVDVDVNATQWEETILQAVSDDMFAFQKGNANPALELEVGMCNRLL